jgi:hypothetical protein
VDLIGILLARNVVSTPATAHFAKAAASMDTPLKIARNVASMRIGTTRDTIQSSAPAKALSSMMDPPNFHCNFQHLPRRRLRLQLHRSQRRTLICNGRFHPYRQARTGTTLQSHDPILPTQATSIPKLERLRGNSDGSRRRNNRSSPRELPTTSVV